MPINNPEEGNKKGFKAALVSIFKGRFQGSASSFEEPNKEPDALPSPSSNKSEAPPPAFSSLNDNILAAKKENEISQLSDNVKSPYLPSRSGNADSNRSKTYSDPEKRLVDNSAKEELNKLIQDVKKINASESSESKPKNK